MTSLAQHQLQADKVSDIIEAISSVKGQFSEILSRGRITRRVNTSKIAIFKGKHLDGQYHMGWHYAPESTLAGDRFHYDHGGCVEENTDGQYLWVCPYNRDDIKDLILNADVDLRKALKGIFRWADGSVTVSTLSADTTYVNRPPTFFIDSAPATPEKLNSIISISCIPTEELDIWTATSERPNDGEKIFCWDSDALRYSYSGPYLNCGEFDASGKSNGRFQMYSGPMIGGLTWASQKSWQSVTVIDDITADI